MLLALEFLGSPRQKLRGNPRKISRQILLSLCSSTREAAQRKGGCSELSRGWLRVAACISWGQADLQEKAGFLSGYVFTCTCIVWARWHTAHYHHPRKVAQQSNLVQLNMPNSHFHIRIEVKGQKGDRNQQLHFCVERE